MRHDGQSLLALCKEALARASLPEAEIFARSTQRGVARFAVSELGQHMEIVDPMAHVRVARGSRVGESTTSVLEVDALAKALAEAAALAELVPETEDFGGFSGATTLPDNLPPRAAAATTNATAEERVERLRPALDRIAAKGLISAGILETTSDSIAIATTRGCAHGHDSTQASFRVWALETAGAGGAAGFGMHMHRDVGALAIEAETARAIHVAELGKNPGRVDVGRYDIVMEPVAVAELLEWLQMISFPAVEIEKGGSPLADRFGQAITGAAIDIVEDPLDASELGFGAPFDREGTPRRRVPLIERGVARSMLHDRTTARRHATESTGSAVIGFSGDVGACALHMAGGAEASTESLIRGMKRGLYICRLHYVNGYLETRRAVMTGLSRDGCFLVQNGAIVGPVGNVRITDSFLEALARADGMTRGCAAIPGSWSDGTTLVAPGVRFRDVAVTGGSQERITLEAG